MESEGIRTPEGHEGKRIFRLITKKARLIGGDNIEPATHTNRGAAPAIRWRGAAMRPLWFGEDRLRPPPTAFRDIAPTPTADWLPRPAD
jgi:hypothetical protein